MKIGWIGQVGKFVGKGGWVNCGGVQIQNRKVGIMCGFNGEVGVLQGSDNKGIKRGGDFVGEGIQDERIKDKFIVQNIDERGSGERWIRGIKDVGV